MSMFTMIVYGACVLITVIGLIGAYRLALQNQLKYPETPQMKARKAIVICLTTGGTVVGIFVVLIDSYLFSP